MGKRAEHAEDEDEKQDKRAANLDPKHGFLLFVVINIISE